MFTYL